MLTEPMQSPKPDLKILPNRERFGGMVVPLRLTQDLINSPTGQEINQFIKKFINLSPGEHEGGDNELGEVMTARNTSEALVYVARNTDGQMVGAMTAARMTKFNSAPEGHQQAVFQFADTAVRTGHDAGSVFGKIFESAFNTAPQEVTSWLQEKGLTNESRTIVDELRNPAVYIAIGINEPNRDEQLIAFMDAAEANGWKGEGETVNGITGPFAVSTISQDEEKIAIDFTISSPIALQLLDGRTVRARESTVAVYESQTRMNVDDLSMKVGGDDFPWTKKEGDLCQIFGAGQEHRSGVERI